MMTQVTLEEAQSHLPELIAKLQPGEELQITKDDRLIARLVAEVPKRLTPRKPGSAIGKFFIVSDDDAHLSG